LSDAFIAALKRFAKGIIAAGVAGAAAATLAAVAVPGATATVIAVAAAQGFIAAVLLAAEKYLKYEPTPPAE